MNKLEDEKEANKERIQNLEKIIIKLEELSSLIFNSHLEQELMDLFMRYLERIYSRRNELLKKQRVIFKNIENLSKKKDKKIILLTSSFNLSFFAGIIQFGRKSIPIL